MRAKSGFVDMKIGWDPIDEFDEDFDLDPSTPTWMVVVALVFAIIYVLLG